MRDATAAGGPTRQRGFALSTSNSERKPSSIGSRRNAPGAEANGLADAAATYNFSPEQTFALAEKLQSRPEKVKSGMQQRGIQTIIEKCEEPGETSLRDTIARALWRLESSRALSDAIVESRR